MTYPEKISTDPEDIANGEREIGTRIDEFPADHIGRYMFARSLMDRRTNVLDLGCGVGYGSHLLSEVAGTVTGLDYRPKVIEYARQNWGGPNITFQVGNALDRTTYPDQKFDFVTAFEIIEHLPDDSLFLKTIKEHLKDDGVLCVSAPNQEVLAEPEKNPWHFRHYTPQSFRALLLNYFTHVALFDQPAGPVVPGFGSSTNVAVAYDTWPRRFSIAFVSQEYPAPRNARSQSQYAPSGGIGTYTQILAEDLARRGHQVHVISRTKDGAEKEVYTEEGVTVHRLSQKASTGNRLERRLRRTSDMLRRMFAVRDELAMPTTPTFDIIEAADWRAETLFSRTGKTRNAVWVTRLHTPSFIIRQFSNSDTKLEDRLVDWLEKLNAHWADEITSPSQALAEICLPMWRLRPIHHLPNPVAIDYSATIPEKDAFLVGYLPGRFDSCKGFPTLAHALSEFLPDSGDRFRFVLLGSDYAFDDSKALLQTLRPWIDDGSETRPITLLPRKTHTETQELSKGLDAVLITSRFENMPYVALEAMASAKLVISPRIGGLPEIIEDGRTGLLFEPDSPASLRQCLERVSVLSRAEIAQMRANAQQAVQKRYGLEVLLPVFEVYYMHLIGQKVQGVRRQRPFGWWIPKQGPLLPAWWHAWRQGLRA
jgi:glycosyltransferase involved in cell wall biosynthesis/ubiquinone/menaquinone biosynthesis C-methylase UbiE